jgi:hypothetical protein
MAAREGEEHIQHEGGNEIAASDSSVVCCRSHGHGDPADHRLLHSQSHGRGAPASRGSAWGSGNGCSDASPFCSSALTSVSAL